MGFFKKNDEPYYTVVKIIGDRFKLRKHTDYWIYTLDMDIWLYIRDQFDNRIGYLPFVNMEQDLPQNGDYVIVYLKASKKHKKHVAGIYGFIQLIGKPLIIEKEDIDVFSEIGIFKYCYTVKDAYLLDVPMTIEMLINKIGTDEIKSSHSFVMKYAKSVGMFRSVKTQCIGESIVQSVFDMDESDAKALISENAKLREEKKRGSKDRNSGSEKSKDVDESDDDAHEIVKKKGKIIAKKNKPDISNKLKPEDELEDYEEDEHTFGLIPICIYKCKKMRLPNLNEVEGDDPEAEVCKYFSEHYANCYDCEIFNNNTKELLSILPRSEMCYRVVTRFDSEYTETYECYNGLKKYNPFGADIEKPTVKILDVQNKEDMYNKSIFIIWTDPSITSDKDNDSDNSEDGSDDEYLMEKIKLKNKKKDDESSDNGDDSDDSNDD